MHLLKFIFYLLLIVTAGQARKAPPKKEQKSLIIIFDGTLSMDPDLEQLRLAAKKIVNSMSKLKNNPIYNYILVVFRDPVNEPTFSTQDPQVFLRKLDEIEIEGGGDCPEMSLSGLQAGVKYALSNSIAYVISDAISKDHAKFEETFNLMKKKQITVNFLLTGDCGLRNTPGYKVYDKLAGLSNGQVFNIDTDGIERLLLSLRNILKDSYATTKQKRSLVPGKSEMPLFVDSTMSNIDIKLSGETPKLIIKNPLNQTVTGDDLTLDNVKIVNIEKPMVGKWNIETESSSEYTVQIGSDSDLKIEYGFSSGTPKNHGETSVQPMIGVMNVLSVSISNPAKVDSLSDAILTLDSLENDNVLEEKIQRKRRATRDIVLKLTKISDNIYITEPFDAPEGMFKIGLRGVDSTGNVIERIVSTAIESVEPSAPEVFITASQYKIERHEKLTLKCIVKSLISTQIKWFHKDKMVKEFYSSQSNECDLIISHEQESNAEKYVCKAENTKGTAEKHIEIEIKGGLVNLPETTTQFEKGEPPQITNDVTNYDFDEHSNVSIKCNVISDIPVYLQWYFYGEMIKEMHSEQSKDFELNFKKIIMKNTGEYTCTAINNKGTFESGPITVNVKKSKKKTRWPIGNKKN